MVQCFRSLGFGAEAQGVLKKNIGFMGNEFEAISALFVFLPVPVNIFFVTFRPDRLSHSG